MITKELKFVAGAKTKKHREQFYGDLMSLAKIKRI